jgi:hypothetical protein
MSYIDNCVHRLNYEVWKQAEIIASTYPNTSRLLAIPIAIGILARDILAAPARSIEKTYLIMKSIKEYRECENPNHFAFRRIEVQNQTFFAAMQLLYIPISPLIALIKAVVVFVNVAKTPLKTAKIAASSCEFELFLPGQNYGNTRSGSNNVYITFANETEFAKNAFERFRTQVLQAENHEAVQNLHFLDAETTRNQFIAEVAFKAIKWRDAQNSYHRNFEEIQPGRESIENQINSLNTAWKGFQERLIKATQEEAAPMNFTFNQG